MKNIRFKQAVELLGYEVQKVSKGYNFRTIWATRDGQLYYFHLEDLRDSSPRLMYRTAESMTDYTGGINRWDAEDKLAELGYKVVEPRQSCDYNSL